MINVQPGDRVDLGKEEIRTMTRRVVSLWREFNLREGMTRKDDCLPSRFHKKALPESGKVITEDELNRLMKDYYRLRGWNDIRSVRMKH